MSKALAKMFAYGLAKHAKNLSMSPQGHKEYVYRCNCCHEYASLEDRRTIKHKPDCIVGMAEDFLIEETKE